MSNLILNKWIPCSGENYWTDKEGYITIVKVVEEVWNGNEDYIYETGVYTKESCPYGWNVICGMKGKLMNIKL